MNYSSLLPRGFSSRSNCSKTVIKFVSAVYFSHPKLILTMKNGSFVYVLNVQSNWFLN